MTFLIVALILIIGNALLFGAWKRDYAAGAWMFNLLVYVLLLVEWVTR